MKTQVIDQVRALCLKERSKAGGWSQLSRQIGIPRTKLRSLMEGHEPLLQNVVDIVEALDGQLRLIKGRLDEEALRQTAAVEGAPAHSSAAALWAQPAAQRAGGEGSGESGDGEYARVPWLTEDADGDANTLRGLLFRRDWLRTRGLDIEQLLIVKMSGDSMRPTIADGDWALVDRARGKHQRGSLVVAWIDDAWAIKRLEQVGERWHLASDNPDYAPLPLDDTTRIIGRAIWRGNWL